MLRPSLRSSLPVLAAAAVGAVAGCVGVPPPTALDERLDFPDVRVLRPQWMTGLVNPEKQAYRPIERSGAVFDPARGLVYVGTSQGSFVALESGTGGVVWNTTRRTRSSRCRC